MRRKCDVFFLVAFLLQYVYLSLYGAFFMKESKTLEFKERLTNTFLKTVSAYANYGTGQILFGVTDSGKEIGVENPDAFCLDIENKIKV